MKIRSRIWSFISALYPWWLRRRYGMTIGRNCVISTGARLDLSINPQGIHIGDNVWVLKGAIILAHDHCRSLKADTCIGNNCVVGLNAIIMPGIHIGDQVIIGSGSVVTKDIPSHCIAVGNPARVVKEGIRVNCSGQIVQ